MTPILTFAAIRRALLSLAVLVTVTALAGGCRNYDGRSSDPVEPTEEGSR